MHIYTTVCLFHPIRGQDSRGINCIYLGEYGHTWLATSCSKTMKQNTTIKWTYYIISKQKSLGENVISKWSNNYKQNKWHKLDNDLVFVVIIYHMPRVVLFLVVLPNRLIVRNNSLKGQLVGTSKATALHCTFISQFQKLYYWIARYVHIIF